MEAETVSPEERTPHGAPYSNACFITRSVMATLKKQGSYSSVDPQLLHSAFEIRTVQLSRDVAASA